MKLIAQALSDDQRRAVAEYQRAVGARAQQRIRTTYPPPASNSPNTGAGATVSACVQCHGPAGVGVGERFPPLAGQSATYIENQLRARTARLRPMGLMAGVASSRKPI